MKLNLPTAILLLAAATGAVWVANSAYSARSGNGKQATSIAGGFPKRIPANQVSFGETGPSPHDLIRDSILQLRTIDSFSAETGLQVQMLGVATEATGSYIQKGQGTPLARWDFQFDKTAFPTSLTQVFDGRFFYRVYQSGDNKTLSCVDLYHVTGLPESKSPGVIGPAGWFGIGGLSTTLEQLSGAFDFSVIDVSENGADDDRMQLITLRGEWKTDSLRQYLRDQVDSACLQSPVQWDRLPVQIPHEVEIVLGSDQYLTLFPYRLVFRQNRRNGNEWIAEPILALQLHHVTRREDVSPSTFVVSSDDVQPQDLTGDFLDRVRMFLLRPVKQ